jgi:hypothetical protein
MKSQEGAMTTAEKALSAYLIVGGTLAGRGSPEAAGMAFSA